MSTAKSQESTEIDPAKQMGLSIHFVQFETSLAFAREAYRLLTDWKGSNWNANVVSAELVQLKAAALHWGIYRRGVFSQTNSLEVFLACFDNAIEQLKDCPKHRIEQVLHNNLTSRHAMQRARERLQQIEQALQQQVASTLSACQTPEEFRDQAKALLKSKPRQALRLVPYVIAQAKEFATSHEVPKHFTARFVGLHGELEIVDSDNAAAVAEVVDIELS